MPTLKENLEVDLLSFMEENMDIIVHKAFIFKTSPTGFFIKINRKDLPSNLKKGLNLDHLCKKEVMMHAPYLDMDLDGMIMNTKHVGGGDFEIFIQFFDHTPQYWIDCLLDMIVSYPEGEFSQIHSRKNLNKNP